MSADQEQAGDLIGDLVHSGVWECWWSEGFDPGRIEHEVADRVLEHITNRVTRVSSPVVLHVGEEG